jgi:hypothetical protein
LEENDAERDTAYGQTSGPADGLAWRLLVIAILSAAVVAALFAILFGSQTVQW